MVTRPRFVSAADRLELAELGIVVGLLRCEAEAAAAAGRREGARELERVARELLETKTRLQGTRPIGDGFAVVVSEQQRPIR